MGVSTEQKYTEFVAYNEALQRALKYMFLRIRNPLLWNSTFNWLVGHDEKIKKYCEVCKSLSRKVLQERRQYWEENGGIKPVDEMTKAEKKRLPFIDVLLSMEDKYQLTEEMILSQIDGIIAAGSDSMSNQIGFNLYLLGHRQQYQDKVYHEIRKVLGNSDRDITYADMDNLKYLWQNICETGRIIPNVVLQARKLSEDTEICGYTVPSGSICVLSGLSIMRDPKHYVNPEIYDPEHFSDEAVLNRDPFAFVPFSAGIRNCAGKRYAEFQLKVTLASVLRKYRVVSMLPEKENRPHPELSTKPSRGFPVRLERR